MGRPTGIGPLKAAIVRALRDITALKTAVHNEFHEGVVLPGTAYPYCVYSIPVTSLVREFGSGGITYATVDIELISDDTVEAGNLDQLLIAGMEDKVLDFTGTTVDPVDEPTSTLLCRRLLDLSSADFDGQGKRVFTIGGRYAVEIPF